MSVGRFLVIGNTACLIASIAIAVLGVYWLLAFTVLSAVTLFVILEDGAWDD